ncbi:MAG TPA: dynamin family protein, partial [Bacillaceae bacterium]
MEKAIDRTAEDTQLNNVLAMLERFRLNGDHERAEKAEKLVKKIHEKEFIAAFSGHFSAGKSTMINALIGDRVLPSSPIPTSANLVKVRWSAEDYAKVYKQGGRPVLFSAPYNFDTLKEFCKRGDVREIEIGRSESELPKGVTVMDTPGIDSTDDAHRLSTESALHLADIVFYVMDYNHVQSEQNFLYTRSLLKHGVRLYLIINQIDKHNDEELSFSDFKHSVHHSFAEWGVEPAGIFFTSLKAAAIEENEFSAVKLLIDDALSHQEDWMQRTISSASNIMQEEHIEWLEEQKEAESQTYEEVLGEQALAEGAAAIFAKEKNLEVKKEKAEAEGREWERSFSEELDRLLKNANLMPFETRQLAEDYLVSVQKDFKVGFLFSRKKTEEERAQRLKTFFEQVKKHSESQIEWHLRQLASNKLSELSILDDELQHAAQKLSADFTEELLEQSVRKGAGVTGESVLNYCESVAENIKKAVKREAEAFKDNVLLFLSRWVENELISLDKELQTVQRLADAWRALDALDLKYAEKASSISQPTGCEHDLYLRLQKTWRQNESNAVTYESLATEKPMAEVPESAQNREFNENAETGQMDMESIVNKLELAAKSLSSIKGFERITKHLSIKTERLKNRQYTVALFGAFSAGKSSFANALLGQNVLPVSPNPTTAAINRICPPDQLHGHGSAAVKLKEKDQMLEDVVQSLSVFGIACGTLDEAYQLIPSIAAKDRGDGREKVHLAFLSAFRKGYPAYGNRLGQTIDTNIEEFQGYVANEDQSCFVESIDLYFDCSFTR